MQQIYKAERFAMIILFGILMSMPGCAKKQHQKQNIRLHYEEKKENVSLHAHKMNHQEIKKKFGRDLTEYGYRPISLVLYNDSDDHLLLRASSFDVKLEKSSDVVEAAYIPTLAYTAAPAAMAGLFFWPALIPVGGLAMWLSDRNKALARNVSEQVIEGDEAIQIFPYERLERVIFVKNESVDALSFHLFNTHKKSFIPFDVEFKV